ncbi:unnamed protein product [Brassica rapa subsp. trilocularis]
MPLEWPLALLPHHRPSSSRSLLRMICALFSNPVSCCGKFSSSVSNFSSSILGDDERVVVLGSLTTTS